MASEQNIEQNQLKRENNNNNNMVTIENENDDQQLKHHFLDSTFATIHKHKTYKN